MKKHEIKNYNINFIIFFSSVFSLDATNNLDEQSLVNTEANMQCIVMSSAPINPKILDMTR
jgi:hypothetical protein